MRFAIEDPNMETAYNCRQFPFLNFKWGNAKKHVLCNGKPQIQQLPTIIGIFCIWILSSKTAKNMRFAKADTNTETTYNRKQFPYCNFKW